MSTVSFTVPTEQAGMTLAAIVRCHLPGQSWNKVRQMIGSRRIKVGEDLCLDPARRLREGDLVEVLAFSAPKPRERQHTSIRYLDKHVVVVEKPSGISTVRHPLERDWPSSRKTLSPTLEELVPPLVAEQERRKGKRAAERLRVVHRLDKATSGLVVFARTAEAEKGLGRQFRAHTVVRRYIAVVPGQPVPQRIATFLVRDRGDKRRGSTQLAGLGKEAITHIEVQERLDGYTLLSCRLETGRTHQIRIHLAELGHPICGEKVYNRAFHRSAVSDDSHAPRLALHAVELGFDHPVSGKPMHWRMELPADLEEFLARLRAGCGLEQSGSPGQAGSRRRPDRGAR
jgi:23S rRNA pseudouridine1911/1915/1917 synthase